MKASRSLLILYEILPPPLHISGTVVAWNVKFDMQMATSGPKQKVSSFNRSRDMEGIPKF